MLFRPRRRRKGSTGGNFVGNKGLYTAGVAAGNRAGPHVESEGAVGMFPVSDGTAV